MDNIKKNQEYKISLLWEVVNLLEKKGKVLLSIQEISETVKQLVIAQWEYDAKERLDEIGFKTDKDIFDFIQGTRWYTIMDDPFPNPDEKDYNNKPIIGNVDYSDILNAKKYVN